jgi:short-subunit dehydrogenase
MAKRRPRVKIRQPIVWVVGASRGIGREIAHQFSSIGCHVCLSGRNEKQLKVVVAEISRLGGHAQSYPCDITLLNSVQKTFKRIGKDHKQVDVLINNAGVTVFKSFLKTTQKEFTTILNTNLYGQIECIRIVLPSMVKRKKGWIINILSNAAVKTFEGSAAYTASKAGMLGLSRVLREEMRKENIKVVNIIPGATETEMWSARNRKRFGHRMMTAKSVAEAVLSVYQLPNDVVVDEIVVRPMLGDID